MKLTIKKKDLFTEKDCYFAHCISRDYALGAGIAKEFNRRYGMRNKLKELGSSDKSILIDNVFNLVTKDKYWHKPTYKSLSESLIELKEQMGILEIKKLAIPKIGCGLDRLDWEQVKNLIEIIFYDTDVEIIVCYL